MPTTFLDPDPEDYELLDLVIEKYFLPLTLLATPIKWDIRMAFDPEGGPGLKRHGHPCAARIEIVKAEERSKGGPDMRIKICKAHWLACNDEVEKIATLHHELNHVEPKYHKKTGLLKLDPYGRPVIGFRPDDWMLTGFRETVRIFGAKAIERQSLDRVEESLRQMTLPFGRAETTAPTIAMSSGASSVTLTGEHFDKLADVVSTAPRSRRPATAAV